MKKFIYLILICLTLPIASLLVGCNKSDYDIKTFYTSYLSIADSSTNLTVADYEGSYGLSINASKIDIDYMKSSKLKSLVDDDSTSYYYLKHFYQQLLDDTLSPVYFFGESISNNKKVTDKQTEKLFKNLETLKQDYDDIDYYAGILISSLNSTNNSATNLSYLKKLFIQYEQALISANNLAATVCDIYFKTVLSTSNFDYSSKTYDELTDSDLSRITIDIRSKLYYYKSVYANIYYQLHVRNNDLADKLCNHVGTTTPEYAPYSYIKSISSLSENPNIASNKEDIHENIVNLYHLQNSFSSAYNYFNTATNHVAYSSISESSSIDSINYGKIISGFANGIAYDSYEILENLITLLYTT